MPDLLLWRPPPGGAAACADGYGDYGALAMAVEVKSKNDALSDKQRLWMMELEPVGWGRGIPCGWRCATPSTVRI